MHDRKYPDPSDPNAGYDNVRFADVRRDNEETAVVRMASKVLKKLGLYDYIPIIPDISTSLETLNIIGTMYAENQRGIAALPNLHKLKISSPSAVTEDIWTLPLGLTRLHINGSMHGFRLNFDMTILSRLTHLTLQRVTPDIHTELPKSLVYVKDWNNGDTWIYVISRLPNLAKFNSTSQANATFAASAIGTFDNSAHYNQTIGIPCWAKRISMVGTSDLASAFRYMRRTDTVRSVEIRGGMIASDVFNMLSDSCSNNLRKLFISGITHGDFARPICDKLEKITIHQSYKMFIPTIITCSSTLTRLTIMARTTDDLDLSGLTRLTNLSLALYGDRLCNVVMPNTTSLRKLNLDGVVCDSWDFIYTNIEMVVMKLHRPKIRRIKRRIAQLQRLTRLELYGMSECRITEKICNLRSLRKLTLSYIGNLLLPDNFHTLSHRVSVLISQCEMDPHTRTLPPYIADEHVDMSQYYASAEEMISDFNTPICPRRCLCFDHFMAANRNTYFERIPADVTKLILTYSMVRLCDKMQH